MQYTSFVKPVLAGGAAAVIAATVTIGSASAQSVEEFYSKNDIILMVGASAGGSADRFARSVAPFLTKYIPGHPDIVVQNKPGAGGLVVAAELQHTAPRDGTYISTLQRNNYVDPLLQDKKVDFDARKVNSLASVAKNIYVIFTYGDKPVTFEEAKEREVLLACTGAGSANVTYPALLNEYAGTKFKCITGYKGAEEQMLALQRGEAEGRAVSYSTTQRGIGKQFLDEGKLHYVVQFAFQRNPAIPDIPTVMEVVDDAEGKSLFRFMLAPQEFARPFAAPPGVPEDRLAALRQAFADAAEDPEFAVALERNGSSVDFVSGEELQELANELMSTPPEKIAKIKTLLAN